MIKSGAGDKYSMDAHPQTLKPPAAESAFDEWAYYREIIADFVADDWERIYEKAYLMLVADHPRSLTKDETASLVRWRLLEFHHPWEDPEYSAHAYRDLLHLSFEALQQGRLWPYDPTVKVLRKWLRCEGAHCEIRRKNDFQNQS